MIIDIDSSDCTFRVLEFCPEGDLFPNVCKDSCYIGNDLTVKQAFLQILHAVRFCHSIGIYHRDLKPENIIVCDGDMTMKLADFDFATQDHFTSDTGCRSIVYISPGMIFLQ